MKVDYATSGGTATAGDDYTVTSGTLAFGPDTARTRTVRVPMIDGSVEHAGETVHLVLRNSVNARSRGPCSGVRT